MIRTVGEVDMGRKTRRTRDDRGASAVEFALLFPVFLLICFGTISGGILLLAARRILKAWSSWADPPTRAWVVATVASG